MGANDRFLHFKGEVLNLYFSVRKYAMSVQSNLINREEKRIKITVFQLARGQILAVL